MSDGQEMGRLQADMETARENLKTLFLADSKNKEEIAENSKKIELSYHGVEANSRIVTGLAGSMDDFKKDVNDGFLSIREDIHAMTTEIAIMKKDGISTNEAVKSTQSSIEAMKNRRFDWPKFMWRVGDLVFNFIELFKNGKFLLFITLICLMIIAVKFPGSVPLLKDLLESAPK